MNFIKIKDVYINLNNIANISFIDGDNGRYSILIKYSSKEVLEFNFIDCSIQDFDEKKIQEYKNTKKRILEKIGIEE